MTKSRDLSENREIEHQVTIRDIEGDIRNAIIAGGDVKNANLIAIGDIKGSYNAIGAGAQVIVKQVRTWSAVEELDQEAQLAERRLAEAIADKVEAYSRLRSPVSDRIRGSIRIIRRPRSVSETSR